VNLIRNEYEKFLIFNALSNLLKNQILLGRKRKNERKYVKYHIFPEIEIHEATKNG